MKYTEVIIHSLEEYIEKITDLPETVYYSGTSNLFHIYRGQANACWDLNPSVYRNNRFVNEANYIYEMEAVAPSAFSGMSRIDKLIKMQHFSLPTRLLDFSRNSLIALYFACCSDLDADGVVYEIHAFPMLRQDSVPISIVMKYLFEYGTKNIDPDEFLKELSQMEYPESLYENFRNQKGLRGLLSKTYGIYPNLTNERIRHQNGVFVMAGMEIVEECGIWKVKPKAYPNVEAISEESRRIIIPSTCKKQIMYSLNRIGINERFLFPGLESDAKWVVQQVDTQQLLRRGVKY